MDVPAPQGITVRDAAGRFASLMNPQPEAAKAPATDPQKEATTEDTPSEVEATPETDQVAEQPDPETPPAQEKRLLKVNVDGSEIEVDEDELKRGYSRHADYTRKTQAAAEVRKAAEAELAAARAERQQYAQTLAALKTQLTPAEAPDPKLLNEDPVEYLRQEAVYRQRKEQLAAVDAEQHRLAQIQQAESQRALQDHVRSEEQRLQSAIPEWKDAKRAKADRDAILEYAHSIGFTDGELAQFYDHRAVLVMRDAMRYRKIVSEAKSKVEASKDAPKTARPGNLQQRAVDKDLAAAKERFSKSHDVRDAGAVLNRLLAPKPKGI